MVLLVVLLALVSCLWFKCYLGFHYFVVYVVEQSFVLTLFFFLKLRIVYISVHIIFQFSLSPVANSFRVSKHYIIIIDFLSIVNNSSSKNTHRKFETSKITFKFDTIGTFSSVCLLKKVWKDVLTFSHINWSNFRILSHKISY